MINFTALHPTAGVELGRARCRCRPRVPDALEEHRAGAVAAGAPQGGFSRGKYFILIEAYACFL
jgi:hypothetical protein